MGMARKIGGGGLGPLFGGSWPVARGERAHFAQAAEHLLSGAVGFGKGPRRSWRESVGVIAGGTYRKGIVLIEIFCLSLEKYLERVAIQVTKLGLTSQVVTTGEVFALPGYKGVHANQPTSRNRLVLDWGGQQSGIGQAATPAVARKHPRSQAEALPVLL